MSSSRVKSKFPWKPSGLLLIKLKVAEVRNSALKLQTLQMVLNRFLSMLNPLVFI